MARPAGAILSEDSDNAVPHPLPERGIGAIPALRIGGCPENGGLVDAPNRPPPGRALRQVGAGAGGEAWSEGRAVSPGRGLQLEIGALLDEGESAGLVVGGNVVALRVE